MDGSLRFSPFRTCLSLFNTYLCLFTVSFFCSLLCLFVCCLFSCYRSNALKFVPGPPPLCQDTTDPGADAASVAETVWRSLYYVNQSIAALDFLKYYVSTNEQYNTRSIFLLKVHATFINVSMSIIIVPL